MPGGIPHDLLFTSTNSARYTKLTDVSGLFRDCQNINIGFIEEETGIKYICSHLLFDKCPAITNCSEVFNRMYGVPKDCQIHPRMFDKQSKVTTVNGIFFGTPVTGAVTTLFSNAVNTITDARLMFARSGITSVGNTFLCNGGINKKLRHIKAIFGYCANLEGTCPEFWNGAKFTALAGDEEGYWGALHQCTKLTNYNTANKESANWTNDPKVYL
jgi:hypothetical protein